MKIQLTYKEHIAMDVLPKRKYLKTTSADKDVAVFITATSKKLISNYLTKQQSFTK